METHGLYSPCRVSHLLQLLPRVRDSQLVPRHYKMGLPDTHKFPKLGLPGHENSYCKEARAVWTGEDDETSNFDVLRVTF